MAVADLDSSVRALGGTQAASDLLLKFVQIADAFVQSPEIKQRIEEDPRSAYVQASDLFRRVSSWPNVTPLPPG
jgi:hypothetical protein